MLYLVEIKYEDRQQSGTQTLSGDAQSPIIQKSTREEPHGRNEEPFN
jgi:hypothetical protein